MISKFEAVFAHQFLRSEFDWLATDLKGCLGFFSTAGAGPIPRHTIDRGSIVDVIDEIVKLPIRSAAADVQRIAPNVNEWIAVAERGVFAFDWRRESRSYLLLARPLNAINYKDIESAISIQIAVPVQLPVVFGNGEVHASKEEGFH